MDENMFKKKLSEIEFVLKVVAQRLLGIITGTDKSITAKRETITIKEEDGKPFLNVVVSQTTSKDENFGLQLTIEANNGMHLADYISTIDRTMKDCRNNFNVVLEGGAKEKAVDCIDNYDRVWFDPEHKKPEEGDCVMVEMENGEQYWCTCTDGKYITEGSSVVAKGKEVEPYKWAWTFE